LKGFLYLKKFYVNGSITEWKYLNQKSGIAEKLHFTHNAFLSPLAVWVPEDAVVNPKKVSEVLAYLAYQGGARFVGSCGASRILTKSSNKVPIQYNFNN
jgi:hypothetical protein